MGDTLVPINYGLRADDFAFLIQHSGARVVCAHSDYLDAVDSIRGQLPQVEHFVALEGNRKGWLDYEATLKASPAEFVHPVITNNHLPTLTSPTRPPPPPPASLITL